MHFCSIAVGEVFVLLSDLNKEWGWGRSQKTGESGLIPLSVMELVVSNMNMCTAIKYTKQPVFYLCGQDLLL